MAFDKHNVIDTMNEEETTRFAVLRSHTNFSCNLGGALALISRGTDRWREVYEDHEYSAFYTIADLLIFTKTIGRDPDEGAPVRIWRYPGMAGNMICLDGDKGDAAQLLGLPLLLFDDIENNLIDVVDKGHIDNRVVVVRRGEARHRRIEPRNRHLVINDPHAWVYWCWQFARRYPQPTFIDGPPRTYLEATPEERSQPLRINNTTPIEDIFRYQRSPFCEELARRSLQLQQEQHIDSIQARSIDQLDPAQRFCSSSASASTQPTSSPSTDTIAAMSIRAGKRASAQEKRIAELEEKLEAAMNKIETMTVNQSNNNGQWDQSWSWNGSWDSWNTWQTEEEPANKWSRKD